jgi:hypothetical protein
MLLRSTVFMDTGLGAWCPGKEVSMFPLKSRLSPVSSGAY